MAEGLKIIVGADITDAQAKLKKVVVDAKTAGKEVEKSFGNARLPLGDIKAYTAAIQNIKQNVSGVSFTQLNEGIAQSGSAASAAVGKIGGLAASLAQGALAGVVLVAAHALVSLVKGLFDSGDAAVISEAALKKYEKQIIDLRDSVKELGQELQFLNRLAGLNAKIFKLPGLLKLQGESLAQQANTARLEEKRTEALEIQNKITADTELTGKAREKAEKDAADAIVEIDKELKESRDKQTFLYRQIGEQRVDDADKAHEEELERYRKFLAALKKRLEEEEKLRKHRADLQRQFFEAQFDRREARLKVQAEITTDINKSIDNVEATRKIIQEGIKHNPILIEFNTRKKKGEDDLAKMEADAARAAQAIDGLLTPAFDGLFEAIKSGENPLKAFFEGLGQAVLQLIQKLIQAAITAAILSAILPGGGGGFSALFGKFLGMASGGLVSGPTLAAVGEGSGTSLSNPEVVAPLDQLKSLLGDIGGGGTQVVVMRTQISGNNLALVQARTSRRNKRLGARA